jgi:hypothetical protein
MTTCGAPASLRVTIPPVKPGFLRPRSLRDEVEEDVAPLRGLTLDERGKILESVCRDAMAILRGREDFETAIQARDKRSPESEETWLRAVKRFRAHGRY